LAIFEDVNFPNTLIPTVQTPGMQRFAFGDLISLSGQTPSGVSISAKTGICVEPFPNVIKKHWWPWSVNYHCYDEPKPDLMFDFEELTISGVPIASGVTGSAWIMCFQTYACYMENTFNFTGVGPIPFSATVTFVDLFNLVLGDITLELSTGPGTISVEFDPNLDLAFINVNLSTTLNPDTNPANFSIDADFIPGIGLTDADVTLTISRSNVDFFITADFDPGIFGYAEFASVTFGVDTSLGVVDASLGATFGAFGFIGSDLYFTLSF